MRRRRGTGGTDSSKVNGLPEGATAVSEDFLGSSSGYSSEDDFMGGWSSVSPPTPNPCMDGHPWEAWEGGQGAGGAPHREGECAQLERTRHSRLYPAPHLIRCGSSPTLAPITPDPTSAGAAQGQSRQPDPRVISSI